VIVLLWLFITVSNIWQFVGIWRASVNHVRQSGSRLWSAAAKIVVVLAAFKSVGEVVTVGLPQVYQYGQIAVGRDPLGSYQLHVIKNASELEVTGAIVFGITDSVRNVLKANPTIRILQINSRGGRTSEARKLRDLIDSIGLTTSTVSGCLSACTLVYAAGRNRLIAKDAHLGFHRYSFPGIRDIDLNAQYEMDKQDWLGRGFARTMVDRAFATPNSEIWTPSHEELLKWGVVTGYAPG